MVYWRLVCWGFGGVGVGVVWVGVWRGGCWGVCVEVCVGVCVVGCVCWEWVGGCVWCGGVGGGCGGVVGVGWVVVVVWGGGGGVWCGGWRGQGPCTHFIGIVHSDIQGVCRSSRIVTALVLKITGVQWGAFALLTSYLMLNT